MPPTRASLIQGWDEGAGRYDELTARLESRFLAPSRRWIGDRASGDVLEVAVGTGTNLDYYPRAARITGLDWSAGMLALARTKARSLGLDPTLVVGDAQCLPFSDASFDTVASTFAMCSVPDLDAALHEMLRVLRPGGTLLLADHVAGLWPVRLLQHALDLVTVPRQGEYWARRPLLRLREFGAEVMESERHAFGVLERVAVKGA